MKATASLGPADFRGLRMLAERVPTRFARGIVLYRGDAVLPFGERLAAWPLDALWAG